MLNKQYRISGFSANEKNLKLQETLFHNANGYLGVRGTLEEGVPAAFNSMRGMYINGFYNIIPMKQSESLCNLIEEKDSMLNIADAQTVELFFNGERFSMLAENAKTERILDMDAGITVRNVIWQSTGGEKLTVTFTRMASFTHKNIFTIECNIHSDSFNGSVDVRSEHRGKVRNYSNADDPRVGANSEVQFVPVAHSVIDGANYLTRQTTESGLSVCTGVKHDFPEGTVESTSYDAVNDAFVTCCTLKLSAGESLRFVKYFAVADSARYENCSESAEGFLCDSFGKLEELYDQQRRYLAGFWNNCETEIDSDDDSNMAMCFNQYQLLQSCGSDGQCGMASKGLSGEGYEGHYFWDTEIFVMPFFTYVAPELARGLLKYRYSTLSLAKENAKLLCHRKGAAYPWRTISGRECSGFFPAGSAQYHVNGDISYAVVNYYLATGDVEYLADEGAEILIETARLWMDLGNWCNGRFVINDVTGPDEYTCIVNNNYYTNACAEYNLRWACRAAEILKEDGAFDGVAARTGITGEELREFAEASAKMYLPYDEKLGINPQDDSFLQKKQWDFENTPRENYPLLLHYHPLYLYRYQVCKQADTILAYILYGVKETKETMLRSFRYYEKITTHDSSLSNCVFSVVAARLGLKEEAWNYFGESLKSDLVNSHGNTGDGIHTANMGGSYMTVVNGFAGLVITEEGVELNPFVPDEWRGYRFRIHFRGSLLEIDVRKNECTVKLLSGKSVKVKLWGKDFLLKDELIQKHIDAVVFDLDGVVCSTDEYHYQAWKSLTDELGIYFDRAINNRLRGVSRMDSLDIILERSDKEYTPEEKVQLAAVKNDRYVQFLQNLTPDDVLPGMRGFITGCKENGMKTALASASKNAPFIIKKLGLENDFDYIADAGKVKRSKPAPDIFLAAAEGLGLDPSVCIGIEDAAAGIEAIHAAGMKAIGIGPSETLSKADVLLKDTSQLTLDIIM